MKLTIKYYDFSACVYRYIRFQKKEFLSLSVSIRSSQLACTRTRIALSRNRDITHAIYTSLDIIFDTIYYAWSTLRRKVRIDEITGRERSITFAGQINLSG